MTLIVILILIAIAIPFLPLIFSTLFYALGLCLVVLAPFALIALAMKFDEGCEQRRRQKSHRKLQRELQRISDSGKWMPEYDTNGQYVRNKWVPN